jgi:hypothetical protein
MNMITANPSDKIQKFNELGLHYNIVADTVYKRWFSASDHFESEYLSYIIAALISFDMGRTMGPARSRYDRDAGGFATLLSKKINSIKPYINNLTSLQLDAFSPLSEQKEIKKAYNILSSAGKNGLDQRGKRFDVGATKTLHFLNPKAFIIIDSNAARAFRLCHNVNFRNTTPIYSSDKYVECMELAKTDVCDYGVEDFCALEKGVPLARIYDKLTFITGSEKS